jgi:hypothetical protein
LICMKSNVFREIVKSLLVTVVGFVILEALLRIAYFGRNWTEIPLTYMFGDDHVPIPPRLDGLRILEPDKVLIWKNRPNTQRRYIDVFIPAQGEQENGDPPPVSSPASRVAKRESNVGNFAQLGRIQGCGVRTERASSVFRIICLGDSWTFCWNFGSTQSYPRQLQDLLRREFPEANFEVFNLGEGYSSFHGLRLLGNHPKLGNLTLNKVAMYDGSTWG